MRAYILTDLEGVCGVASDKELSASGDAPAYQRARSRQLAEINATIRGLKAAGADDILVYNGHGPAWDLPPELLERPARLVAGHPVEDGLPGLDDSFNAFCVIGQHAMAGDAAGVLDHTGSNLHYQDMILNDKPVGEFGLSALLAGEYNVPTVLASGDRALCVEAKDLVPGIYTVETKAGLSRNAAIHRHPADVCDELEQQAKLALEGASHTRPPKMDPPYDLTVKCGSPVSIQRNRMVPGIEIVDSRTYRIKAGDLASVMRLLMLTGWIV